MLIPFMLCGVEKTPTSMSIPNFFNIFMQFQLAQFNLLQSALCNNPKKPTVLECHTHLECSFPLLLKVYELAPEGKNAVKLNCYSLGI